MTPVDLKMDLVLARRDVERLGLTTTNLADLAIQGIRQIVAEVETEWETQLGAASFAQLRELLTQLRAITSNSPAQPPAARQP